MKEYQEYLKFKKKILEDTIFNKKSMFEKRGRIIMSIKNIEILLE